jgi:cytochrome bd-type quinol oxidase subunit 2
VVYAIFAVAAVARSTVQIISRFDEAPVAYVLSAVAAAIYVVATIALARGDKTSRSVATVAIAIEMAGVVIVGIISLLLPDAFPRASVWSNFGSGYLFIPLVLPIVGLWWLRYTRV